MDRTIAILQNLNIAILIENALPRGEENSWIQDKLNNRKLEKNT
jgi:hypothetical protein